MAIEKIVCIHKKVRGWSVAVYHLCTEVWPHHRCTRGQGEVKCPVKRKASQYDVYTNLGFFMLVSFPGTKKIFDRSLLP